MVTLSSLETDLRSALKQRKQIAVDTLRGLKTRLENERIARGQDLGEDEIITLVVSEVKRRNEAAAAFQSGNRPELAEKEREEAAILSAYLPAQADESKISAKIDELKALNNWVAKDFGVAMGQLKKEFGNTADGALLAKVLKEKLM